ncbi:hypothetical protein GCM10009810_08400 [Nostocoides vanveenii]|uniref:Nucleotide pyrophosphohydrolase n=2 Tax=Nostocoides vanveenii TaxID=330835 RepID=A0ABP4WEA0_9MICO
MRDLADNARMPRDPDSLEAFQDAVRTFSAERDWRQFHDPKSLLLALVGEVGELAELFQWVPADEALARFAGGPERTRAEEEISDVFIYLLGLVDVLGIDLLAAARAKLAAAAVRYPIGSGLDPDRTIRT